MTRTEELMKLCDGSTTLAALLQEDLRSVEVAFGSELWGHGVTEAIAAFNKFEGGEK